MLSSVDSKVHTTSIEYIAPTLANVSTLTGRFVQCMSNSLSWHASVDSGMNCKNLTFGSSSFRTSHCVSQPI